MDTINISESTVKSLIQIAVQKHQSDQKGEAESLDKTREIGKGDRILSKSLGT